jgi:hypothetical protein
MSDTETFQQPFPTYPEAVKGNSRSRGLVCRSK